MTTLDESMSDKLISRDAVLDSCSQSINILDAMSRIEDLPSVTPKQEPCEMTAEEYRQRMIQAFHNADTDELIAICVLPTEKEFEYLEWLLKNHYKKEPFEDAISRQAVWDVMQELWGTSGELLDRLMTLPSVTPKQRWIPVSERLPEDEQEILFSTKTGRVYSGKYHDDDSANQWYSHRDKCRAWNNVVNAWMPLPKPYEVEPQESEEQA